MGSKKKMSLSELSSLIAKKLCLRCKTDIEHYYYECRNCGGFYCSHCPKILQNHHENCKYCGDPIQLKYKKQIIEENKNLIKLRHYDASELQYHIHMKRCLLCNDKINGGYIYRCPMCGGFYCENCAYALTQSDHKCLGCNEHIQLYSINF